jgi:hypothetical protein
MCLAHTMRTGGWVTRPRRARHTGEPNQAGPWKVEVGRAATLTAQSPLGSPGRWGYAVHDDDLGPQACCLPRARQATAAAANDRQVYGPIPRCRPAAMHGETCMGGRPPHPHPHKRLPEPWARMIHKPQLPPPSTDGACEPVGPLSSRTRSGITVTSRPPPPTHRGWVTDLARR